MQPIRRFLGVGNKLANFLSDTFSVTSTRDGIQYTVNYENGLFANEEKVKVVKKLHGTKVSFTASTKYLRNLDKVKCSDIAKMIESKAECLVGIDTSFKGIDKKGNKTKEIYKGLDILDLLNKYNNISSKIYTFELNENDMKVKLAFGWDTKMTEGDNIIAFCNYIKNHEGGTHVKGLITGLTEFFRKYMNNNFLSDKEKKELQIRKDDICLGLCGAINLLIVKAEFKGQYKEEVTNPELEDIIAKLVKSELKKLPEKNLKDIALIIKMNAKARLSSQRARAQVKQVGNRLTGDHIEKYIPAPLKYDGKYLEVYYVEGDRCSCLPI